MSQPSPVVMPGGLRPLTDREFTLFRDLIYREAGIHLSPVKKALLVGRLSRRLRELGLCSFRDYYEHVTAARDGAEKTLMLERICTHETHFFREPRQFEFLERSVFPAWKALADTGRRQRQVRVWSAACSTGQEPYSMAMLLLDHFPPESGWSVEIVATDLSNRALDKARAALWPVDKAEEIPPHLRKRFMLKGVRSQAGLMKAGPEIRALVRFQQLNLNDRRYALQGPFDVILCRNVMIYFDQQSRAGVVNRLVDLLSTDGYLLLGHAETLNQITDRVRNVGPTIYAPPRPAADSERCA